MLAGLRDPQRALRFPIHKAVQTSLSQEADLYFLVKLLLSVTKKSIGRSMTVRFWQSERLLKVLAFGDSAIHLAMRVSTYD